MTQHQHELTSFMLDYAKRQRTCNEYRMSKPTEKMIINYFPHVHSHFDNLFTLMFMLQLLKYADMNSQVFAELPTSAVVSDISLLEETLLLDAAFFTLQIFHTSPFIFVLSGLG